jgi:oligopeptide transport system substrate-binding protein
MPRLLAPFLLLLLSLLTLSSCSQQHRADLVVILGAEPESLDPAIVTGQVDQNVAQEFFEGLTHFNRLGLSEPAIASSWEISSDQRIYTFHLRHDARWSNGQPITAHDVVASWRRVLIPATGSANRYQLFVIEGAEEFASGKRSDFSTVGVEALDAETLKVTLRHPTSYFLDLCALPVFSVVPTAVIERVGDNWIKPGEIVTSGPYLLADWRINDRIRLQRNPFYWNRDRVALATIDLLLITQATTAYNFYASGEGDIIFGKLFPPSLIEELKKRSDFHSAPFLGTEFLRFNCHQPPFDDVRVRQAFSLCIDQKFLTEKIARSGEIPAESFVPPGISKQLSSLSAPSDLKTVTYHSPHFTQYDPERARQLLAEAGYPAGRGFPLTTYLYNEGQLTEGIAVELQSIWKRELGLSMLLARQEWKVYLTSLNMLDYGIGRSSWVGDYPDPNTFLDIFLTGSGNNRTGWKSSTYDRLIQQAAATSDLEERFHLFQEAEQFLVQDSAVIVPLFYYASLQIYDATRWGGIEQNVLDEHPLWQIYKK